ncbi:MAG: hypothetical protein ACRD3J_32070 [Thermoanaerobaculia bacterium]
MPFNERYTATYTAAIRPAIQKIAERRSEQWECLRSDDIRVPGSITKEIVTSLHTADLVIADLTGHNPNVFYELGVAHSAGRATVMITQTIEELPFDINTYRVHPYTVSPDGLRALSDHLSVTVLDLLGADKRLTNPVLDFAPVRHAHLILSLDDIRELESRVSHEVWLIEPSLDTDLSILAEIVKHNLRERGIKYRYLLPRSRGILRQWERLIGELGYNHESHEGLQARTVEPHIIESEVVIYDPYGKQEDVLIMSPREQEFVFWYRVGRTRGESMRDRYETLWETESEPMR